MSTGPSAGYFGYPFVIDAQELMSGAFDYLQSRIPGWEPSEGQLDVWLIEAVSSEAADIGTLVSEVPKSIFRYLGLLMGFPPLQATQAITTSTWYLSDDLGHDIVAGTQVAIVDHAGNEQPFTVLTTETVPGGQSISDPGEVVLIATFPGSASNDIGGAGEHAILLDTIPWVDDIILTGPTTGGSDGETDDQYLSRLTMLFQTISPRPILPRDFAILARNVPGVQRAAAIDLYNPVDNTTGNERMITIVAVDAAGNPVSMSVRTAIQTYLDSMREINFQVHTMDPVMTQVDITTSFTVGYGFTNADVVSRVEDALAAYVDPARWGTTEFVGDAAGGTLAQSWQNDTVVSYLEVATVINNQMGVDRIVNLTIGKNGGPQYPTDLVLSGMVALPYPGSMVVTTI